uniref:Uncharacterized protein n=1 Tax=Noccaea caerulescens TaxID=107243 RepID=A0A1J3EBR0_NOCCA
MAKLTVTVTVTVLLFTLALSVVSSKPETEIIDDNLNTLSAEPDSDTTNPTLPGPELTSPDEVTIPVNFVNFHPINRHFPRRPLMTSPFQHHHRPCHHHRRHELFGRGIQISFGNDMIFSGEEKATGTERSSEVDIPAITMLVDPFSSEMTKHNPGEVEAEEDGSMKIIVKFIKRKEEGEDEKENYKGLFKRKIRKFLNHLV